MEDISLAEEDIISAFSAPSMVPLIETASSIYPSVTSPADTMAALFFGGIKKTAAAINRINTPIPITTPFFFLLHLTLFSLFLDIFHSPFIQFQFSIFLKYGILAAIIVTTKAKINLPRVT